MRNGGAGAEAGGRCVCVFGGVMFVMNDNELVFFLVVSVPPGRNRAELIPALAEPDLRWSLGNLRFLRQKALITARGLRARALLPCADRKSGVESSSIFNCQSFNPYRHIN